MCIRAILDALKPKPKPPGGGETPTYNRNPIAYPPFTTALSFARGSRIDYDLRYREHGCSSSGSPLTVSGAWDPDGDTLDYIVTCEWSVFAYTGTGHPRRINGEWLRFPKDDRGEQQAIVTLFFGWVGDQPPYTYAPKSCCVPDQPGAPEEGCNPNVGRWNFTYAVRDRNGAMASHTLWRPIP